MECALEDQERHLLVKVIDFVLTNSTTMSARNQCLVLFV